MRRKIYDKLVKWKNDSNGKTALLTYGAQLCLPMELDVQVKVI